MKRKRKKNAAYVHAALYAAGEYPREKLLPEKSDSVLFVVFIAEKLRGGGDFFSFTKFFTPNFPSAPRTYRPLFGPAFGFQGHGREISISSSFFSLLSSPLFFCNSVSTFD